MTDQIRGDSVSQTTLEAPQPQVPESPANVPLRVVAVQPAGAADAPRVEEPAAVELHGVSCWYGSFRAVRDITFDVPKHAITALIGPSGSGKSTLLRAINRMNDLIPGARVDGQILYHGENLYAADVDPVEVRRRIGMVFQKPNPFPKSI
jgi:phosphate transport system ATP-binding protein